MIELQAVSKRFGRRVALADVTFTAPAGAITGLIGPNGAGKTTVLKLLAGLIRPDSGAVLLDGYDARNTVVRRRLGVLTESQGLYTRLTVREHLQYSGALSGLEGLDLRRRTDELLQELDLHALAQERTAGFSRGQQTRVSLARALMRRPSLLVLDEPTSTLDIPSARTVRAVLRRLRVEGACILLASHVMSELEELADRLVLIADGRVIADGTADELRAWTKQSRLEDAFVVATAAPSLPLKPVTGPITGRSVNSKAAPAASRSGDNRRLMRESAVVLRKEFVDYWRDRPSQVLRAVLVVFGLLGIIAPLFILPQQALQVFFEPVHIGVVGADNAPALIAYLAEQQIAATDATDDPVTAVQSGSNSVVLVIPHDYAEQLAAGLPAQLRLVADTSRMSSDSARQYVNAALVAYGDRVGRARLLARGVDPVTVTGVRVAIEDVSASVGAGAFERAVAPSVVLFTILVFGITSGSLAVQVTAGERERRTLEPLLNETNRRAALVLSKTGAALGFGLLPSVLIMIVIAAAVPFAPAGAILGTPKSSALLLGLVGLVLAAPPIVAFQMLLVTAFSGSADAAMNRIMLLTVALTGIGALTVSGTPTAPFVFGVPIIGAVALMGDILLGQGPSLAAAALALVGSAVTLVLTLWLVTRLYEREAIMRP